VLEGRRTFHVLIKRAKAAAFCVMLVGLHIQQGFPNVEKKDILAKKIRDEGYTGYFLSKDLFKRENEG
jgi:hypothetical protein